MLANIGVLQGRAESITRKITEVNARLATLQSELATLEAGAQRERDHARRLEIEAKRAAIRQEIDQSWGAYVIQQKW